MGVPTGLTQQQAVAKVRNLTNETTLPSDTIVTDFLNEGLEQVNDELEVLFKVWPVAVGAGLATVPFPQDIQEFQRATFSTALPTAPGVIEYPLTLLGSEAFVDQTGSAPTVAGGPVIYMRWTDDENGVLTAQVYPLTTAGYVNIYGKPRPTLWDANNSNSLTNLDPTYQRVAVAWACVQTCRNRENYKKATYWQNEYERLLEQKRVTARDRKKSRGSVVRDVTSYGAAYLPPWMKYR